MKEVAPARASKNWNAFIDGGADLGDLDHNQDIADSNYTGYRVRAGADFHISTNIRVGALFGYEHTDASLDNEGSKAHVDGFTPGIYASYADKAGFYANGLFTYTHNDYSPDRNIIIPGVNRSAHGSTSGDQFGGDLDGGYEYRTGGWVLGPSVGLTYVNLGIDSFNETGANSVNLAVNNQSAESLRSRLGGAIQYQGRIGSVILTPHVSAFWQHEFLDSSNVITSSFEGIPAGTFVVHTPHGDRDNALLGAGLNVGITDCLTIFADYGAEVGGQSFFGQSATGGVRMGF
jgi:outer membrane autotransporter protein